MPRLIPAKTSHIQHPHKHSKMSHSTLYATIPALQLIIRVAERNVTRRHPVFSGIWIFKTTRLHFIPAILQGC